MTDMERLATRYWAATVPLLGIGLATGHGGFIPAVLLTLAQMVHFGMRAGSMTAFPVQVRIAYLMLLLASQLPLMLWIAWAQLIGTTIRVLFNYCFLARTVSLLPWNRVMPLSRTLLARTYLSPPTKGSILQHLASGR